MVVAHDGRAFILTIVPWVDTDGDFSRLENLDSTVIESCRF